MAKEGKTKKPEKEVEYTGKADAIRQVEKLLEDSTVIVYVSRIDIGPWDILPLYNLLEDVGKVGRLNLIIQSSGGYADDAYKFADVLHEFCEDLRIVVPTKAKSAATLVCLAGSEILMGPTSELGPTDPMIMVDEVLIRPHALGQRQVEGSKEEKKVQMNAHALRDFLEAVGVMKEDKTYDLDKLFKFIERGILNPWLLGDFERSTKQVSQFAEHLLRRYMFKDKPRKQSGIGSITKKLCEGYYHHNYPIGRREAREIGLEVTDMPPDVWKLSSELVAAYTDMMNKHRIRTLMETSKAFNVAYFKS